MRQKTSLGILFMFLLLPLLSILAYGNAYWSQEANAGQNFGSNSKSFTGYSSNFGNIFSSFGDISYSSCVTGASNFTPVAFDVDKDGFPDLVSAQNDKIIVYDQDCSIKFQYQNLNSKTITSNLVITNFNQDSDFDVSYFDSTFINVIQFNSTLNNFQRINFLDYSNLQNSLRYISCGFNSDYNLGLNEYVTYCLSWKNNFTYSFKLKNTNNVYSINISNQTTPLCDATRQCTESVLNNFASYKMSSPAMVKDDNDEYVTYPCLFGRTGVGASELYCLGYNKYGEYNNIKITAISKGTTTTRIDYVSSFIAKVQGSKRLFINVLGTHIPDKRISNAYMYDLNGNLLFQYGYNHYNSAHLSNWLVGDYDKDGQSDACIIQFSNTTTASTLLCLDASGTEFTNIATMTGINYSKSYNMADYYPEYDVLGFADYHGVFYYNDSSLSLDIKNNFNKAGNENRSSVMLNLPTTQSPIWFHLTDYSISTTNINLRENLSQ